MPNLASHVIPSTGGYEIGQSLRFNDDDSAYLSRTPASAGNRKTWTWSAWVKRGNLGTSYIFQQKQAAGASATYPDHLIGFRLDKIRLLYQDSNTYLFDSDAVFRDASSWYHIVVVFDTTEATSTDRAKLYVNGVQQSVTWSGTFPLNFDGGINTANVHSLARSFYASGTNYADVYLADVHFIDGQALDASYFGETDADYGHWKPIKYTGTYGTNGFYLDFSNSSSLGQDQSGNSNDWTSNNLAATDVVLDSPTNNFATLNPLDKKGTSALAEGNLKTPDLSANYPIRSTAAISSGLWYWEVLVVSGTVTNHHGIWEVNTEMGLTYVGATSNSWGIYDANGNKRNNASFVSYGSAFANGDVLMTALDMDSGKIWWGKNGTWFASGDPAAGTNAAFTNVSGTVSPAELQYDAAVVNFGQDSSFAGNKTAQGNTDANGIGDFYYAPPSGYLALCTQNLPDPTVAPADHFNTLIWSGAGNANRSFTGVGFQPDLVWTKSRSQSYNHLVYDVLRGTGDSAELSTPYTFAEGGSNNESFDYLSSFDADGFSSTWTGTNRTAYFNESGVTYVAWNWKANGTGVSNSDGTITSTVSANQDAGFSIVSYTGEASAGTVGHGLSQTPDLYIFKKRDTAYNWLVYTTLIDGSMDYLYLNLTDAKGDSGLTAPTSSVLTAPADNGENTIAYCFHSVDGFSKFGTYTGNGSSDGPFVYTGFRPAFLIVKRTDSTSNWSMFDNSRDGYNVNNDLLLANGQGTEYDGAAYLLIDFLSNGFKLRSTNVDRNASGGTYIFMAFAETPAKFSNAR